MVGSKFPYRRLYDYDPDGILETNTDYLKISYWLHGYWNILTVLTTI